MDPHVEVVHMVHVYENHSLPLVLSHCVVRIMACTHKQASDL